MLQHLGKIIKDNEKSDKFNIQTSVTLGAEAGNTILENSILINEIQTHKLANSELSQ